MRISRFALVGTIVAVLAAALLWYMYDANVTPVVSIPPQPALPSPNAYDAFMDAAALLGSASGPLNFPGATVEEKRRAVLACAPGMEKLREGLAYDYGETYARSIDTLFPQFGKCRDVARTAALIGDFHADKQQWPEAAQGSLDACQMGMKLPYHGTLIGCLVGMSIRGIGMQGLWAYRNDIDPATAAAAARRLEAMLEDQRSFADILTDEKYFTQASLLELIQQRGWRSELTEMIHYGSSKRTIWQRLPYLGSKRDIMTQYTRYMDAIIAESRKPPAQFSDVPLPRNAAAAMVAFQGTRAHNKILHTDTLHVTLMTELALRAYHAKHQAYPETLEALTPAYLQAVPRDPFGDGTPLRYRRTKDRYVLYSVGPDGKDDGGTPCPEGQVSSPGIQAVDNTRMGHDSTGDFVSGVNFY